MNDRMLKPVPKWVRAVRWILSVGTIVYIVGVMAQGLFIGQNLFNSSTIDMHAGTGWILGHSLGVLLLIVSLLGRYTWQLHVLAAGTFVVGAIVPILAAMKSDNPAVAQFHPFGAMLLLVLALTLVYHSWVFLKAPTAGRAPTKAAPTVPKRGPAA